MDKSSEEIVERPQLPTKTELSNYPNPFNPVTKISFTLPGNSLVKLSVYSISGNKVETLINGKKGPGLHTVVFNGSALSSGVYIYKLQTKSKTIVKRMLLIK